MAGRRVHFVMPDDLVSRIDAALSEGVSRGEFVRRAVEQALGESRVIPSQEDVGVSPAPAERPGPVAGKSGIPNERVTAGTVPYRQHVPGPNVAGIRSSSQSKRDVRPIPKKGER